ncbi:MAG: DUF5362 domain-containing protein [Candidatus Krumholzibacteriota bacterium]|nr:DUF5362 domain-containing protein [Candidatus Krumholzibacteriota bacterium]
MEYQAPLPPVPEIFMPRLVKDMRFVGIWWIVYGALQCLSIIGAIIGIPMIFAGVRIREAADGFEAYHARQDVGQLGYGFERQGRGFFTWKVIVIIQLALIVVSLLFWGLLMMLGLGAGLMNW